MTDIQQARDVLAKWRTTVDRDAFRVLMDEDMEPETGAESFRASEGVRLIVGTAGNPDLLDAIDGLLRDWTHAGPHLAPGHPMGAIAAAIIAADERMTS